ncbi:beta-ketoacyl synthase N-terminal-like domain-containing protein [Actinomadura sp. 3N508]|uniref:beta-ketoacyl synthase N-terminal-like domain-containing protein n=1 Tax=Actinomadura sp. 3N508 TaxID=3375153 RepID=UPI003798CE4C
MTGTVITGMGLALPGASTPDQLWRSVTGGRSAVRPIDRFDTDSYPCPNAGFLGEETERETIGTIKPRVRKRMDRFCQLAASAARSAEDEAGIAPGTGPGPGTDPERTGVYVGNMFGGWEITEASLRGLLDQGYTGVSPHIASAWFPTAPQGQITIGHGLTGFSKTLVADSASAAVAIGYGARAVADGRVDVLLAGGAEAPVTPYTYTFCTTSGRLSPTGTYRPGDDQADGFCVGEGAVMFVIEREELARARDAIPLARLAGFAVRHVPEEEVFGPAGSAALATVLTAALDEAGTDRVDCLALDAQGTSDADESELSAIRSVLGSVPLTTAKPATGNLLGAAPAVDAAVALLSLRHQTVPPVAGCLRPRDAGIVVGAPREVPVGTVALLARGADGTIAASVLQAV